MGMHVLRFADAQGAYAHVEVPVPRGELIRRAVERAVAPRTSPCSDELMARPTDLKGWDVDLAPQARPRRHGRDVH